MNKFGLAVECLRWHELIEVMKQFSNASDEEENPELPSVVTRAVLYLLEEEEGGFGMKENGREAAKGEILFRADAIFHAC